MNSYLAVVEASGLLVVLRLGVQSCCLLSVQFSEHRYVTNNQQLKVDKSSFFVLRMSRSISDGVRTPLPNPFHRPHQPANAATPTAPRSRTSDAEALAAAAGRVVQVVQQRRRLQDARGSRAKGNPAHSWLFTKAGSRRAGCFVPVLFPSASV